MRAINWHGGEIRRGTWTVLLLQLLQLCPQLTEKDPLWILKVLLRTAVVATVCLELTVELAELVWTVCVVCVGTEDGSRVRNCPHVVSILHLQHLLPQLAEGFRLLV